MADPLVELMQAPECRPLLDRLRKRLQRGEMLSGRCRLTRLSTDQCRKISEMTGARPRGASVTIDLNTFSKIVGNTGRFATLRELVEHACGRKIENLRAKRNSYAAAWENVWDSAHKVVSRTLESPGHGRGNVADPHARNDAMIDRALQQLRADDVHEALRDMRETGWLQRLTCRDYDRAGELLKRSLDVLRLLPVSPTPLAIFSANHCGDAHALDSGQTLSRILFRLIAFRRDVEPGRTEKKAVKRRRVWESVGLVPDELSSSVLALNLPTIGEALCDVMLRQHHEAGMPCRLTFRHLRLETPRFPSSPAGCESPLYVCENPSVIAAASDRRGAKCPPMICVEGHPSLTCWSLLEMLCHAGFRIHYHGDFDWGGIRIANKIYEAFGFEPWRFTASDHRVKTGAHRKLRPPVAEASWDRGLKETILASGVAVEEESMIEDLINDLS